MHPDVSALLAVKQDDLGAQAARSLERRLPVGCLAEHPEAVDLEQRSRTGPEVGMVVDDQQAPGHASIVAPPRRAGIGAVPSDRARCRPTNFHPVAALRWL